MFSPGGIVIFIRKNKFFLVQLAERLAALRALLASAFAIWSRSWSVFSLDLGVK